MMSLADFQMCCKYIAVTTTVNSQDITICNLQFRIKTCSLLLRVNTVYKYFYFLFKFSNYRLLALGVKHLPSISAVKHAAKRGNLYLCENEQCCGIREGHLIRGIRRISNPWLMNSSEVCYKQELARATSSWWQLLSSAYRTCFDLGSICNIHVRMPCKLIISVGTHCLLLTLRFYA